MATKPPKLLLIGWDAADWRVIDPLIEAGKMPHLANLIGSGARANLRTLHPALSPMLWTSIATGKRPYKHGIHGFSEVDPEKGTIRPISGDSRTTKAIWNVLGQEGLKTNVVGWWPSHPAEPINGVMVSNFYQRVPTRKEDLAKGLPRGTVQPSRLQAKLASYRVHPDEFTENHLGPFLPNITHMNWREDQRVHSVARLLAECSSIHSVATGIMALEPWDFMAVYHDAIDHFSHGFMKFHPHHQPGIREDDFESYHQVVTCAYQFHDMMLGTMLQLAGENTTIMLISDHGFHPDEQRVLEVPNEPAGPAVEHRAQGIFVANGPGIPANLELDSLGLLDIAPTVLHHFGLPVGADMDGEVIGTLYPGRNPPMKIPSWDLKSPGTESTAPPTRLSEEDIARNLRQLVELGYIDPPDQQIEIARKETQRELDYNLARAHMDGQQFSEAAGILDRLCDENPSEFRFALQLATCWERMGKNDKAAELIRSTVAAKLRYIEENKGSVQAAAEALEKRRRAGEKIPQEEQRSMHRRISTVSTNPQTLEQLQIRSLILAEKYPEALDRTDRVLEHWPDDLNLLSLKARLHVIRQEWSNANQTYQRVLDIEPLHEPSLIGLSYAAILQRDFWHAAAHAKEVIKLAPQNPWGHYYYGCALLRIKRPARGLQALQQAVKLDPDFVEAWQRLARFYSRSKRMEDGASKARDCRAQADRALKRRSLATAARRSLETPIRGEVDQSALAEKLAELFLAVESRAETLPKPGSNDVVIVSGLPRSGTSLVMQMLQAGGFRILADEKRQPDVNNPRGFFEFEPVKRGKGFDHWMPRARGKAVKIIAPLLRALPRGENYRIIFCRRPVHQIVVSQHKMISRLQDDQGGTDVSDSERVALVQSIQTLKMLSHANIPLTTIDYVETVQNPANATRKIKRFLGGILDETAMASVVDESLHREKN